MLIALLIPLAFAVLVFAGIFLRAAVTQRLAPKPEAVALGAVVSFFDTLGIGSFAPTMAWLKLRRLVPDGVIPSTMLVGLTAPSMVQAIIFLVLLGVLVDPILLVGCSVALVVGGLVGAPLAARTRVWVVQTIVGLALILAGALYAISNLGLMPGGGLATSLPLPLMIIAIAANGVFGILLNFGIGNYAPTLAMLSIMGMDPRLSFPIMAAGASFAGAAASVRHISIGVLDMRVALGLALGGIPAVLLAAFVVKEMPVETLRWLVVVVVLYAAVVMLRAAWMGRLARRSEAAAATAGD